MKQIPLSRELFATVDDDDFEKINQYKWYALKSLNTFYAHRQFRNKDGKLKSQYMHRVVLNVEDSKIEVDHKNKNGLDNTKSNLRQATKKQNAHNRSINTKNTTGFRGVFLEKRVQKYRAQIRINGKINSLGYFSNPEDASAAYETKAKEIFNEFYRPLTKQNLP
jgi:hypothetical protein